VIAIEGYLQAAPLKGFRNWDVGRTLPTFPINEVSKVLKLYQCSLDEMAEAIEVSRAEFLAKQKNKQVKS
jgi:hypothetical protein